MRLFYFRGAAVAALLPTMLHAQQSAGRAADDRYTIVVTASPFATFSDDTPSIVAKIDRYAIPAAGGPSIADPLADVPGISATSFASDL